MHHILLICFGCALVFQKGIPGLPVKAGLIDLMLGILFPIMAIMILRRKRWQDIKLPPLWINILLVAVLISGMAAAIGQPSAGLIKEGIQIIEVLVIAWLVIQILISSNPLAGTTIIRAAALLMGIEAIICILMAAAGRDLFSPGVLSLNRNTYSMMAMLLLPLAAADGLRTESLFWRRMWPVLIGLLIVPCTAAGALLGGLVGILVTGILLKDKRILFIAGLPFIIGISILMLWPAQRQAVFSSIAYTVKDNGLEQAEDKSEYTDTVALHNTWFEEGTAMRYRRWKYIRSHITGGFRQALIGSGPGSYTAALKPYMPIDRPNLNTDIVFFYNRAVDEPDTFSAYGVLLVEIGIIGLGAYLAMLIIPLIAAIRKSKKQPMQFAGIAGSILAIMVVSIFHSPLINGINIFMMCILCMAAAPVCLKPDTSE